MTTAVSKALKKAHAKSKKRDSPLWGGPEVEGITQSMIGSWLSCRERFRLNVIDGIDVQDEFKHAIEYGQMWHTCEEQGNNWQEGLKHYCMGLVKKYPYQKQQIEHWYNVCKVQYPIYLEYWDRQKAVGRVEPLFREEVFKVPYKLPSGRTVLLRGKWDGANLIGSGRRAGIYLLEHKTKGDINEEQLARQLSFDLQTMTYLIALQAYVKGKKALSVAPIKGVVYNVVRRPLSGGKGSIRQHKPTKSNPGGESSEAFYKRLADCYIKEDPSYFFMRWDVDITPQDVQRFKDNFLDPVLENICWWYGEVTFKSSGRFSQPPIHWRHPYGVYNPMDKGRVSDLDDYLATGSMSGLHRRDKLFTEL